MDQHVLYHEQAQEWWVNDSCVFDSDQTEECQMNVFLHRAGQMQAQMSTDLADDLYF